MTDIYTHHNHVKKLAKLSVFRQNVVFSLKTDQNLHMDKFVVKMPMVSLAKEASSHLLPNLTAHDQARKYPECTFHVDDGLMFCSSCIGHKVIYESIVDRGES